MFGTVRWLRGQRRCLVSNVAQYRFIYDVLEDYITSGETAIDLEDLSAHISALDAKNNGKVCKLIILQISLHLKRFQYILDMSS